MARRKVDQVPRDDAIMGEHDDTAPMSAPEQARRGVRRRPDVPMGRILLSLPMDTIRKLRYLAISEGVQPCEVVERVLRPIVAPYVLSIRGRRAESEDEAVA